MENLLAAILNLPREERVQIYNALEDNLNDFDNNKGENHLSDEEWGLMDEKLAEGNGTIKAANHEEVMRWLNDRNDEAKVV